jgi:SAM-dependent methyltransferase
MWNELKGRLRAVAPRSVLALARQRRIALVRARNLGRTPAEIFGAIYRDNKWGGAAGTFSSGSGSTAAHAGLYAGAVRKFASEHGVRRIVDLGCGDFTVGAELVRGDLEYVGVDIVPEVVERNRRLHGAARVSFECRNIIDDELPDGDLCLVRQVLQHLSNEQIAKVLRNLGRYRRVLVTEHYPALGVAARPNLDKPCGEDVRVYDDSGVYLDAPPFSRTVRGPLLDVDAGRWLVQPGERLRTYLLEHTPA